MMPDKKRKRGRPRVAPVLSYGSELKLRNNITRNIKKPRYLRDQDEEDSISRGSTPARSLDNVSLHSKSSGNGKSRNGRGYNPEIDDKDSEYHYGSDFDMEEDSDIDKYNQAPDSRSISEATSDLEESDLGDLNIDEGESLIPGSETAPNFVPFWKLGPAGTLGHRPQTPIPVWLQDRKFPPLELPTSSDDLLMPLPYVLQAVGIYEVLRHFRNIARLSPFHFEDFCTCLLAEELTILLSEIHISLIKALIREEEIQQTHYGQLDQKDSINIALYFVDPMTWPETLKVYLQSDSKEFRSTLAILDSCSYPYTTLENRLSVLQFLCDQFLQTTPVREDLLSEGKIRYDDHCRACHKTGDLLCCDSCPAVYHLDCADPPLSNVPLEIEDWTCTLCNKHKLEGVTDCSSLMETSGMMSRQEPIGYDRHGRKYWFLVRRIIVESEEGNIWYYSTLEQLDLLMVLLDSEDLEEVLYVALKEFGDDIRRQMEITEKITDKARGSRKAEITLEMEETRKEIEKIQKKKEKDKKKDSTENLKDIIEEVKTEESSKSSDEIEVKVEVKEEEIEELGAKKDEKGLKESSAIDLKTNIKENGEIKKEKVFNEEEVAEMIETKMEQLRMPKGMLYRLGCDLGCRTYVNNYVHNTLALNKLQHNEERDKKRHLSHKFSLTSTSDFKWQGQCYGSSDNQMTNIRQTILSLEQNISPHFYHPNWQYFRKVWIRFVDNATTSCQFGKALLWLVTSIKPVVFTTVWHESLGHIRLKRITVLDREERKRQEKRERREAEDESKLFPLVKFTKGVKHQLWKTKGEEYRIHGLWGWQWLSANRKVSHVPMSTVGLRAGPEKITIPIKSNGEGGGLIRGLPISASSYNQLAAKTPSLQFSLLSPKQKREEEESKTEGEKKKKEIMLANAGQFEVSPIDLENYFDDGVINVSNELNSRLRLVYPKLTKGSSFLDGLLPRRLTLKIQEERDLAKNKKSQKEKKERENDHHVDVENDSDSSGSDDNNNNNNNDGVDDDETVEENIEEIPDSQRRVTIHKRRPAGHLLKEMRMHKFKYEALDKMDEMLPCYSPSCRKGSRSSCYSPSCIIKMKTKQKLVNSVSNYKIITSKPAPFDNIGSCSPVRLNDENETDSGKKLETAYNSQPLSRTMASNGQIMQLPASVEDKEKALSKLPMDEDSSHSLGSCSSDQKTSCKGEKVFSSENTSGKIYLKKSTEIKKQKKHKIPPINYFRVMRLLKKEEDSPKLKINKRSLFILPTWELSIMARKGGKYCPGGFNPNAKVNHHIWPYPCPRPVFKITWLYRTTLVNSINAVAYQLRILWTCLKWDEMHEKGPADGRKQITTDIEIIQTEILKRKITGRFLEKTNYLRRKVVIPLDVPKPVREFTPSQRSGLRKRRRAQSPINQQPQSSEEWVEEDKVDLWEIKFFGERLEKAATLSKKSERGESGSFSAISRSTSPAEFKARMEEQLKIQRANFNQKKSIENQSNASSNKGIVKVAIGSAVTGNGSGSKLTFTNSGRLIQTPSIVTMGSKLPSVLAGKKIVTTKGGKIITVQTSGGGLTLGNQQSDSPSKLSVNKSSVFPVSSLPKVQVTPQGNKVIKLQNINTCGQRTILPRVVTSQNNSQTSVIRPFTTNTSTTQNFQPIATSTPVAGVRPVVASQQIQIFRMPDGQFQVKGLQEGQQLLQRGDGKLQVVNTKITSNPVTSNVSSNPIQVTQQTKPASGIGKDTQVRGIAPLSGNQILRINGQQVILRTSSTAPNGKSIANISPKDTPLTGGNVSVPKFKPLEEQNPKVSNIEQNQINSNPLLKTQPTNSSPLKNQPVAGVTEEKSKMPLPSTPPASPTKGAASSTPGVTNTMTLRVQVRMTEQGPKTIIQGLQPGVGLTKDHIMAIQQQVRSMLAQYNLQVNQLSPLMTLTLQSTNKNQQHAKVGNTAQQTSLPSSTPVNSLLKSAIGSDTSVMANQTAPEKDKAVDILGVKDLASELKENSQTIQTALNKNDLTPDVEEKLLQLQKFTKNKKSPQEGAPAGKGSKRLREDEGEWDPSEIAQGKAKSNKRAKSEKKLKKDGLTSPLPISAVTSPTSTPATGTNTYGASKTVLQDARKKLARQQKLEGMLGKHKDLLKKDILKKRALLEKELQLQIHKELSLARQQLQTFEKLKTVEAVSSPPAKKPKQEPAPAPIARSVTPSKDSIKTKKGEPHPTIMSSSGSSALKTSVKTSAVARVPKKSNKTKSKKIVCICRTFFDDTKFYVGCDLCGNWFHGDCVGITEALSRSMTEYVCDDCANAKLNKDLFCFCRQPYDETQFYICCEKCEDWYHGKCIGIMQAEADDIDDYICPKCEPDNKWNRPCQKKLTDKDYAELKKVAKLLIQHKNAWPFLEPVDQSEVPDYYKVVKHPMDLKAVERKVQQRKYKNLFEFVGDVMLVFDNCRAYNPPNSSFFSCANTLEGFFCLKLKQLKLKIGQKS